MSDVLSTFPVNQVDAGFTGKVSTRKVRCRVLRKVTSDRCESEALSEFGLCMPHLRAASEEWAALIADALEQCPGLQKLLDGDDPH